MARRFWKIAPYCIVMMAFALRVSHLDLARYSHDSAIPFSYGARILDDIGAGRWSDIPLLSLPSGVQVQNPIGASVFWAVIELFTRSIFAGSAVSVLLNALAVAMTYDLGRRIINRRAGFVAALLMATSIYSVYVSRATWIQGQLEFWAAGAAWLVLVALRQNNPRRLIAGFAFAAFAMQTYLAAMALAVPITLCAAADVILRPAHRKTLLKPALMGAGLCAASAAIFAIALMSAGSSSVRKFDEAYMAAAPNKTANADNSPDSLAALNYALNIAGGADFDFSHEIIGEFFYSPGAPSPAFNQLYVGLISALIALGTALGIWGAFSRPPGVERIFALIWFFWLIVLSMILALLIPRLNMRPQYMLLASPAGYLLAGMAFAPAKKSIARVFAIGAAAIVFLAAANSLPRVLANYQAIQSELFFDRLDFLPIGAQMKMAQIWRGQCAEIASPQLQFWTAAAYETSQHILAGGAQNSAESDTWMVRPEGGTCVSRIDRESAPLYADTIPLPLSANTTVNIYRNKAVDEKALAGELGDPAFKPLYLNLGWTLLVFNAPPQARAGETISITQAWRINPLPDGASAEAARFTQFVNLRYPDGRARPLLENGYFVDGRLWQAGKYALSRLNPVLPDDLPSGEYQLELSLYDARQKQNAVYFSTSEKGEPDWDKPMIHLIRKIVVAAR